PAIARPAIAGHRVDRPIRRHYADPHVERVDDVQIAGFIDGDILGIVERGARSRNAIAGIRVDASAGDGGYRPVRGHLADTMTVGVGNVHVPVRIHGNALRVV